MEEYFICLAVVSWPCGLAVVPAYCRNSLSASDLNTAQQLETDMKRLPSRDRFWKFSKPTYSIYVWFIWFNYFLAVLCGTPPAVENAHLIGRRRSHYDIHSVVRYQCSEGFYQRHIPTTRCRPDGSWERPRIICTKSESSVSFYTYVMCKNIIKAFLFVYRRHDWKLELQ